MQHLNEAIVIFAGVGHPETPCLAIDSLEHYHIKILGNIYCNPGAIGFKLLLVSHRETPLKMLKPRE
jgi:hypothetical protein